MLKGPPDNWGFMAMDELEGWFPVMDAFGLRAELLDYPN